MSQHDVVIVPKIFVPNTIAGRDAFLQKVVDCWGHNPPKVTLPDMRGIHLDYRNIARYLKAIIVFSCRRFEVHWGDQRMRPIWWPKRLPFENPGVQPWYKGVKAARDASIKQHADLIKTCYEFYGYSSYCVLDVCYCVW